MKKLTLLQINDTHAYLEPHLELFWQGSDPVLKISGGYARIAAVFNRVREETGGAVIALDNGDTFHGTFVAVHSQGEALIDPMNLLGLDAMTAHWDFAYGPEQLNKIVSRLNYPMLAINCYRKDSGNLAYSPYQVIERGGLKVGVLGIAATIVDKTMPKHFSEGLIFTLGNEELPGYVHMLRDELGVDLVVVLSHLGFPQDVKMAAEVPGVDAWLSGHTHNRIHEPFIVNGVPIIQSGCHGSFVGRLDLCFENGKVVDMRHELIHVDESIEEDPRMKLAVELAMSEHRSMLTQEVGHTDVLLHRSTMLSASMDEVLLRAIAHAAGTKIAFSNGWRYGAPIAPGPITTNDLWNIIPSNPPVSKVELSGEEIKELLETNLENTFACDPYNQMGGYFKRSLGIEIYLKIENPKGARIQEMFVEAEPLDRSRTYEVAYVTTQGVPRKFGKNRTELKICAVDALKDYLSSGGKSDLLGRVKIV